MTRSTYAFCHGDRGAVRTACVFIPAMVVAHVCKDRIAIVEEIPRRLVLRKDIPKLLRRPRRCWTLGDRHVGDSSTVMRDDHEHEQQSERDRRHDEEVGGHDLARVIGEEGPPRLGRWTGMPSQVFGDGGLTDRDPQLQKLAVHARRTPQRIRRRHLANQRADIG